MNPHEIRIADVGGGRFAYRARQVLARGAAAENRAVSAAGESGLAAESHAIESLRDVSRVVFNGLGDDERDIDALVLRLIAEGDGIQPNHVLFAHADCSDPEELTDLLPPQTTDDECCSNNPAPGLGELPDGVGGETRLNPFWANPFWANPFWANPFWANPFWANAKPTSAIPVDPPETLPGAGNEEVSVFILDSGLGDFRSTPNEPHPTGPVTFAEAADRDPDEPGRSPNPLKTDDYRNLWLQSQGNVTGDYWDRADLDPAPWGDGYIDGIAGHGTFIAGIYEQLVPGCRITVRSVIGTAGEISEATIAAAIQEIIDDTSRASATIINMSFGGPLHDPPANGGDDVILHDVIRQAAESGVMLVASAGNDGVCEPTYPAAFPEVVAVAALGPNGAAAFSNRGEWVDACTIGVDIRSTFITFNGAANPPLVVPAGADNHEQQPTLPFTGVPGGIATPDPDDFDKGWAVWSGTSFAAPIVGAAIIHEALEHYSGDLAAAKAALIDDREPGLECFGVPVAVPS